MANTFADGLLTLGDEKIRDEDIVTSWGTAGNFSIFTIDQDNLTHKIIHAQRLPPDFNNKFRYRRPSHLQEHVTVVISTLSGTHQAEKFFDGILKPLLDKLEIEFEVVRTSSSESVKEYAQTLGEQKSTVLLLSGDGGVVDILNNLPDIKPGQDPSVRPTIVLFPLGTANALFHSTFRKPLPSYSQALRTLLSGTATELPNFSASFDSAKSYGTPIWELYGAVVASYGFHATLVARSDTPEYRKFGSERFGMVAKDMIENPHTYKARVNGEEGGQYVMATLVSNLEKTFTVAPECQPLAGKLWLVHLKNAMDAMKGYQGEMEANPTEKVVIEMLEEGICCIDGTIVVIEEGGHMTVEMAPAKVNIVVDVER